MAILEWHVHEVPHTQPLSCSECGEMVTRFWVRWVVTEIAITSDASEALCAQCAAEAEDDEEEWEDEEDVYLP